MNNTIIACVKFISWNEYETITSQGYRRKLNARWIEKRNVYVGKKGAIDLNEKKYGKILIHSDEEK